MLFELGRSSRERFWTVLNASQSRNRPKILLAWTNLPQVQDAHCMCACAGHLLRSNKLRHPSPPLHWGKYRQRMHDGVTAQESKCHFVRRARDRSFLKVGRPGGCTRVGLSWWAAANPLVRRHCRSWKRKTDTCICFVNIWREKMLKNSGCQSYHSVPLDTLGSESSNYPSTHTLLCKATMFESVRIQWTDLETWMHMMRYFNGIMNDLWWFVMSRLDSYGFFYCGWVLERF